MRLIVILLTGPGGHLSFHMAISRVCSLMVRFGLDVQKRREFSRVQTPLILFNMTLLVLAHDMKKLCIT